MSRKLLVAVFGLLTAGCPATWGVNGQVFAKPEKAGVAVPLTNIEVWCDGCSTPPTTDDKGGFVVDLGASFDQPAPVVVHVSSPGHRPVAIDLAAAPYLWSQAGPAVLTVVLEKTATAPVDE